MLSETVIRRLEALGEISKQGKPINGLFRLLENPLLWNEAYANIYANDGATTPGTDGTTLDGFSQRRVEAIIRRLKDGSYRFQPARRTYVPKKNGKKRPLGISSGDDKLVQEVVRIILERIYEPIFEECSHGFRPGRSPHTALEQIGNQWGSIKWMVDMDIRSYFDTIPHELLVKLLKKKIEDKRFIGLIQALLDAGYLEDWTYHTTYSGVPQGSICSPILANIYLHELDLFMKDMKRRFERGKKRKKNRVYHRLSYTIERLRKEIDHLKGKEEKKEELQAIQQEIRRADTLRKHLPSGDPFDAGYKRLHYCRYADDFLIGIIGSHADAQAIRQQVRGFIEETLHLTIAEEKSHIRHSKEGATFVGYQVKTYSGDRIVKVKRGTRHTTFKAVSEKLQLHIPPGKLQKFCLTKGYGEYATTKAIHRKELAQQSDAEIITVFNGELRGLMNYYVLAFNVKTHMHKLYYIWQRSLLKTLANKHKTSINQIVKRLKTEDGLALTVQGEKMTRTIRVFRPKDLKMTATHTAQVDRPPNILTLTLCRSELIRRLNANKCEYCQTTTGPFEVHHIRKMKDVAHGKRLWQKIMAARNRKTLVLCRDCHHLLHAGKLPDREHRTRQVKGEPDAWKSRTSGSVGG
jgi:group II intron reverse transcriptase/maturase